MGGYIKTALSARPYILAGNPLANTAAERVKVVFGDHAPVTQAEFLRNPNFMVDTHNNPRVGRLLITPNDWDKLRTKRPTINELKFAKALMLAATDGEASFYEMWLGDVKPNKSKVDFMQLVSMEGDLAYATGVYDTETKTATISEFQSADLYTEIGYWPSGPIPPHEVLQWSDVCRRIMSFSADYREDSRHIFGFNLHPDPVDRVGDNSVRRIQFRNWVYGDINVHPSKPYRVDRLAGKAVPNHEHLIAAPKPFFDPSLDLDDADEDGEDDERPRTYRKRHFDDHGHEFGAADEVQYERLAQEFMETGYQDRQSSHVYVLSEKDSYRVYFFRGGAMAVLDGKTGYIQTFFKPNDYEKEKKKVLRKNLYINYDDNPAVGF